MTDDDFDAFYLAQLPALVGFLTKLGGSREDARDCAQTAFVKAYERWAEITAPRAWIYETARNVLYRQRTRSRRERDRTECTIGWWTVDAVQAATDEDDGELLAAIAALPTRQREVMSLYHVGFTPTEIARILAIKPEAARGSLSCARRTLKAKFTVKGEMT
ncbi:sigma-70 family RNA polymerase sigma factor [Phytomonospora sp. NPDC050363]|uniref:RNA polymerase sigma factor n=1 Tax=Phytomonospora sp. NPDC050363 TaxID=3155642 RepID=UPI0033D8C4EE